MQKKKEIKKMRGFYATDEEFLLLRKTAEEENRSVSQQIIYWCKKHQKSAVLQ